MISLSYKSSIIAVETKGKNLIYEDKTTLGKSFIAMEKETSNKECV